MYTTQRLEMASTHSIWNPLFASFSVALYQWMLVEIDKSECWWLDVSLYLPLLGLRGSSRHASCLDGSLLCPHTRCQHGWPHHLDYHEKGPYYKCQRTKRDWLSEAYCLCLDPMVLLDDCTSDGPACLCFDFRLLVRSFVINTISDYIREVILALLNWHAAPGTTCVGLAEIEIDAARQSSQKFRGSSRYICSRLKTSLVEWSTFQINKSVFLISFL